MSGPGIPWYLVVSGIALLDRRDGRAPAAQPADRAALARDHAQRGEPRAHRVLAPARRDGRAGLRARGDGGRRRRGVRRPRPDRRDRAPRPRARRRRASRSCADDASTAPGSACSRRSRASSRSCSRATRITRRQAGIVSTASVFVGFAGARRAFVAHARRGPGRARAARRPPGRGSRPASFEVGLEILIDPLSLVMMLIVTGVGGLIVLYSIGYMDGRRRGAALLRLHGALRLLDADARDGRQPAAAARRLGPRRARLVPADRLLPRARRRRSRPRRRRSSINAIGDAIDGARLLPR